MPTSEKRQTRVPVSFSESQFNDLARLANEDNRSVSDLLYVVALRFMYGVSTPRSGGVEQSRCDTLHQRVEG